MPDFFPWTSCFCHVHCSWLNMAWIWFEYGVLPALINHFTDTDPTPFLSGFCSKYENSEFVLTWKTIELLTIFIFWGNDWVVLEGSDFLQNIFASHQLWRCNRYFFVFFHIKVLHRLYFWIRTIYENSEFWGRQ